MKPLFKNIVISFLIIFLAFIVFYFFLNSRPVATAKQESIELPIVNTVKLSSIKYLLNIKTYGEIVSDRILNIKYRENGKVVKIGNNIKNGEYINKGDLIFKIDSFYIDNEIAEKTTSRKILFLNLKKIKSQISTAELRQKEIIIQRDIIKNQLDRRTAAKSKAFSDNSIDELRLSLSLKEQSFIDNIELINILKIEFETLNTEIDKIQIIIDKLNNDLKETAVFSPFSGHISNLNLEVGKEITSNDNLAVLSDTDNLEAKVFIGGSDYFKLTQFKNNGLGEIINIKWMIGNKYYKATGKISRIDGLINKEIAGINIYAQVNKSLPKIPLGAFVEINLKSNIPSDAIMVPTSSIFKNKYIYLVSNNRLVKREIIVISEEREGIIIQDNNLSGNYIATTRLSNMKDNMQVDTLLNNF
ncbi:MAG: HlyD family efflux transporter periplasmic adaptor subunit [Alphaproteobacteria bacterium]|tara:strand:- start:2186 stop:3433 length:1248 start_codon:yes stop_codon:yes gene_type:complete